MRYTKRILTVFLILTVFALSFVPLTPKNSAAFSGDDKIVIVLDPGHGGRDVGTTSGIQSEAHYNLQVALAAKAKLEENGSFTVHMTRSTPDEYLTTAERLYFADSVNADIAVSFHFNSSATANTGGVEVYSSVLDRFYLGTLSQMISTKVADAAGIPNRGVFRKYDYGSTLYYWSEEYQWDIPADSSVGVLSDYYGVITWGAKFGFPAIIVEHAYLSNDTEHYLVDDPQVLRAMGEADAEAIIEYYTNHTHSYGSEIIDAPVTCFSAGKKSVHCTVCDHRINVTSVAAAPDDTKHIWLADGTPTEATCDSDGYAKYYCRYTHNLNDKGCEQFTVHYKDEVVPAYGHDYQITFEQAVSHTVDGITTYTCTRCNTSYNETVAAEGHSYSLTSHTDPDCVNEGYDTYTCSVCNDSYNNTIAALGHDFTVLDSLAPTCTEGGFEHKICNTCSLDENITLNAVGHTPVLYSDVMANCTEEGLRITKCSVCGFTEEITTPKAGHSFTVSAETAPDCENKGERLNTCIVCSYEETVILDPTGHEFEVIEDIPADCETEGKFSGKCRICGETETKTTPATGHSYVRQSLTKAPGLFFDGEEKCVCENDPGHFATRSVPDLTLGEFKAEHPVKFWLTVGGGVIPLIALIVIEIITLVRKYGRPAHAKPKSTSAQKKSPNLEKPESVESSETEKTPETEPIE